MPNTISLGDVDPSGHCGTVTEIVPPGGFARSVRVRFTDGCLKWAGHLDQPPAHAVAGIQGGQTEHGPAREGGCTCGGSWYTDGTTTVCLTAWVKWPAQTVNEIDDPQPVTPMMLADRLVEWMKTRGGEASYPDIIAAGFTVPAVNIACRDGHIEQGRRNAFPRTDRTAWFSLTAPSGPVI